MIPLQRSHYLPGSADARKLASQQEREKTRTGHSCSVAWFRELTWHAEHTARMNYEILDRRCIHDETRLSLPHVPRFLTHSKIGDQDNTGVLKPQKPIDRYEHLSNRLKRNEQANQQQVSNTTTHYNLRFSSDVLPGRRLHQRKRTSHRWMTIHPPCTAQFPYNDGFPSCPREHSFKFKLALRRFLLMKGRKDE